MPQTQNNCNTIFKHQYSPTDKSNINIQELPSLLFANKQIHHESISSHYKFTTFSFQVEGYAAWLEKLRMRYAVWLWNVSIEVNGLESIFVLRWQLVLDVRPAATGYNEEGTGWRGAGVWGLEVDGKA